MLENEWKTGFDNTYSVVLNSAIEDSRISPWAFRVLAYLAGKPHGWNVFNADVAKKCSMSQKRLSKAWKELEDAGWIIRKKSTNNNDIDGKCGTYKYTLVDPSKASKCDIEEMVLYKPNIQQSSKTLKERSNNKPTSVRDIPYQEIIDYFNVATGANRRVENKKVIGQINARFDEGFTLDDFKIVIDKKVATWKHDDYMCKYLKPETLFSNKFEGYLNEISVKKTNVNKDGVNWCGETIC